MSLSDTEIKAAKPREKQYSLPDGEGLHLYIKPNGKKYWRFRYRFNGKAKMLGFGVYPRVTLKQARTKRNEARDALDSGSDPSLLNKLKKQCNSGITSFKYIASEWHTKQSTGQATHTVQNRERILNNHLYPYLGESDINEITVPQLLAVLRKLEGNGKIDTAHRARGIAEQVFKYAIGSGLAERNPAIDIKGVLTRKQTIHHPAITDPMKLGEVLRKIDQYGGSFPVLCALKLTPMLFVRPVELRTAQWHEINLDQALWTIPAEKTKMRREHLVPLSTQAVAILRELHNHTGKLPYVFSHTNNPMSNSTVNAALRRMRYSREELTGHGFRTTASTILHEQGYLSDAVERQMAHVTGGVRGIYNKAQHIEERTQMMQSWSDYLSGLKADLDNKVVSLRKA